MGAAKTKRKKKKEKNRKKAVVCLDMFTKLGKAQQYWKIGLSHFDLQGSQETQFSGGRKRRAPFSNPSTTCLHLSMQIPHVLSVFCLTSDIRSIPWVHQYPHTGMKQLSQTLQGEDFLNHKEEDKTGPS